ncbi:hypothetical protein GQ602_006267 [Ophiocordyceps camponoti-floridani]|uniref:Magnesium-dependent phosphatase-1 n=1 Tax=Ophiocordyceps camponoti-floridani TaxID=2030778 RepID=A0A8H4Q2Z2_9HYPO|nr:hypothetical protein GQ602_006267 [Ophiocordyceps camponoti-floridani]
MADLSPPLPKLIIFDLDYTLWPFWIDTHVTPPLRPNPEHSSATDRTGEQLSLYTEVPSILDSLRSAGVLLGVASRTSAPSLARQLLTMLHVEVGAETRRALDVFDGRLEIYPGSKVRHMEALQARTGVAYQDMLFFDDESRNRDTEKLGLTMWLVRDGMSAEELRKGLAEWRRRRC